VAFAAHRISDPGHTRDAVAQGVRDHGVSGLMHRDQWGKVPLADEAFGAELNPGAPGRVATPFGAQVVQDLFVGAAAAHRATSAR
jgi:hypothetical protein